MNRVLETDSQCDLNKDVKNWDYSDVGNWVETVLKLPQCKEKFINNEIDGEALMTLSRPDIIELGIINYSQFENERKKLIEVKNNISTIPENCISEKNIPKFYSEDEDYLFALKLQQEEEEEARKNIVQQTRLNTKHSIQNEKLPVLVTKEKVTDLFTQFTPLPFNKQEIELEKEKQRKLQEQESNRKLQEQENNRKLREQENNRKLREQENNRKLREQENNLKLQEQENERLTLKFLENERKLRELENEKLADKLREQEKELERKRKENEKKEKEKKVKSKKKKKTKNGCKKTIKREYR